MREGVPNQRKEHGGMLILRYIAREVNERGNWACDNFRKYAKAVEGLNLPGLTAFAALEPLRKDICRPPVFRKLMYGYVARVWPEIPTRDSLLQLYVYFDLNLSLELKMQDLQKGYSITFWLRLLRFAFANGARKCCRTILESRFLRSLSHEQLQRLYETIRVYLHQYDGTKQEAREEVVIPWFNHISQEQLKNKSFEERIELFLGDNGISGLPESSRRKARHQLLECDKKGICICVD